MYATNHFDWLIWLQDNCVWLVNWLALGLKFGESISFELHYLTFNVHNILAPSSMRNLTMSKWPSKQAALSGVELVFVVELTLAPRFTRNLTTRKCPAAAAHHNGGAPSIVSPSNPTASTHRLIDLFVFKEYGYNRLSKQIFQAIPGKKCDYLGRIQCTNIH